MLETLTLYVRLLVLILFKLLGSWIHKFAKWFSTLAKFATRPAYLTASATSYPIVVIFLTLKQLVSRLFSVQNHATRDIKLGVAVLTRFPIAETASVGGSDQLDNLQASLKDAALFERVIGEATVCTVVTWLHQLKSIFSPSQWPIHTQLYLVYRKNYTSAFSLSGWLSVLPNHLLARSTHALKTITQENTPEARSRRCLDVLSKARHNLHNRTAWEDPDGYCSSRTLFPAAAKSTCSLSSMHAFLSDGSQAVSLESPTAMNAPVGSAIPIEYVTVEGLEFNGLLEVAVRVALRSDCNYVVVLNPRAIGLRPDHLSTALQLLTGFSSGSDGHRDSIESKGVDVVLGLTGPSSYTDRASASDSSPGSPLGSFMCPGSTFASPTGLYLLGLRAGRRLMLGVHQLTASVEWATSTTATRLWASLARSFPDWTVVCMRERLEELMKPPDLLALERNLGVKTDHLMEDRITMIIPMGPGHTDDGIDLVEDVELIDVNCSKALAATLELAVYNASGKRPIDIIIIVSTPSADPETSVSSLPLNMVSRNSPTDRAPRFRSTHLRPMTTVTVHHYPTPKAQPPADAIPRRGQLIRYAVQHLAKGSMLVFVEPGIQLPLNWDSAVFHSLQRPGVGMGCFAYRLDLHDKYIHRKSVTWAMNCWLANYVVNLQTRKTEVPIVGQPHFIYAHYLACLGGYPESSRMLHPIDLALLCRHHVGRLIVTRVRTASAGVPANFALRHGAYRTAVYTTLVALARYFGATECELRSALSLGAREPDPRRPHRLPLVQPHYLDGY